MALLYITSFFSFIIFFFSFIIYWVIFSTHLLYLQLHRHLLQWDTICYIVPSCCSYTFMRIITNKHLLSKSRDYLNIYILLFLYWQGDRVRTSKGD